MPDRPNILLIALHDVGRQIDVYDPELPPTPSIRRIAEEGVVFENHFSTCPLCSPARASIQTGRYPHSNGMNGLTHRGFKLNDDEKCLPQYLREAGYHTALYGLQHEAQGAPERLGYEEICGAPDYPLHSPELTPHIVRFLERPPRRPFLLSVGFAEVHRAFNTPQNRPVPPDAVKVPPYLKDCPEVRKDLGEFHGLAQVADRDMALLLEALDRTGLSQSTLLLFTTDHGFAFPRAKSTLYDPGIGVTLLARWPGTIRAGGRARGLTSHTDILPTLLELAGAPGGAAIQGRSFAPLLSDPEAPARDCIFAEKSWHGNEYDPMRCVRTEEFKYIRNFTDGYLYQLPLDIKHAPSGKAMDPLRRHKRPATELYYLPADPGETLNISGNSTWSDVESELSARLEAWMRDTSDPLPDRPIAWPQPGKEHFLNNMDAPLPA